MTTRQEIEALGKEDPIIRVAIHRMYANCPPTFASDKDKWISVLQDLVMMMHVRHTTQTEESITRHKQRANMWEPPTYSIVGEK